MIILTVGTQLPFDRLIRIVDDVAPSLAEPVIAQIGEESSYVPVNMEWSRVVDPLKFDQLAAKARVIVGHAGVGTVLMAQRHGKPMILFPRQAALGEHRNDHQMATVSVLEGRPGVHVARTREELVVLLSTDLDGQTKAASPDSRETLKSALATFIRNGTLPA